MNRLQANCNALGNPSITVSVVEYIVVKAETTMIGLHQEPKVDVYKSIIWAANLPALVSIVIPLSKLRLNPFSPIKNVPRDVLKERMLDIISDSFGILDASQGLLSDYFEYIFSKKEIPCFNDLVNAILFSKPIKTYGRKQLYQDSLESRVLATRMSLGKVYDCEKDYFDLPTLTDFAIRYPVNNIARRVLYGINSVKRIGDDILAKVNTKSLITLTGKDTRTGTIDKRFNIIIINQ